MTQSSNSPKKLNPKGAKSMIPFMKEFNFLARDFLKILRGQVDQRERRVRLMVTEMALPVSSRNLQVHTIDMHHVRPASGFGFTNRGSSGWEQSYRKNRGHII